MRDQISADEMPSLRPFGNNKSYVFGVDFVRFAAAMLVALFHLTWLDASVSVVAWYGWVGVQIFFVISGFVIARSANDVTPIRFVKSRLLRLYPAAWACATISFFVLLGQYGMTLGLSGRYVASMLLSPVGPFLASAYWTLPIEIAFYGLIFVTLLSGRLHQIESIAICLSVASAIYILLYGLQCAGVATRWTWLEFGYGWKNLSLLRHGIYFGCGVFFWLWSEGLLSRAGTAAWLLTFCAAPLEITCRSSEIVALMPVRVELSSVWLIPVVIWLFACGLIALSTAWRLTLLRAPALVLRGIRVMGLITYPVYLVHETVGELAREMLLPAGIPYLAAVLMALTVTTAVAAGIALGVEPALRTALRGWLAAARSRYGVRIFAAIKRW